MFRKHIRRLSIIYVSIFERVSIRFFKSYSPSLFILVLFFRLVFSISLFSLYISMFVHLSIILPIITNWCWLIRMIGFIVSFENMQETKSGALKKTSRYRSRSLSASSTDSYSSGNRILIHKLSFILIFMVHFEYCTEMQNSLPFSHSNSRNECFCFFFLHSFIYGQQFGRWWCFAARKNTD